MRLRSCLVGVLLAVGALLLTSAPASASARTLWRLTDLAAQRVQIADKVAAAKFGTPSPIDDPVREKQIYDSVAAKAPSLGLDPAAVVRFFHAQIEANKFVQRGLYARWTAHPEEAPTSRPDLATEVRPVIDRLNAGLLSELAATRDLRASRWCPAEQVVTLHLVDFARHLDTLHARALGQAVQPTCD